MLPDDLDWAWAAGLFEGEGCMSFRSSTVSRTTGEKREYPTLRLQSTDEDVVRRFHLIVGCGTVREVTFQKLSKKEAWVWSCAGMTDIEQVLLRLTPYFGERRRARARELLQVCAQRSRESVRRNKPVQQRLEV